MQKRRTKNNRNNKRNKPETIKKELFFTVAFVLVLAGICAQIQ